MRKAIIVWGGWLGHEPEQCATIIGEFLRQDGFETEITDDLAIISSPRLAAADLLVPVITGGELEKTHADALVEAVRGGLGLGGHHGALATSFKESGPFRYVSGVTWVAHPGDIIDFRVTVTCQDDPLMDGIPDFDYRSEQYYLHYDPSVEILATTTFTGKYDQAARDVTMPVVLKRHFGAGRVFYCALGHVAAEFDHPYMPLIVRRGLSWAARH
jgi:type 1 glutamine amidotransferase